jgi:hypothetical protein
MIAGNSLALLTDYVKLQEDAHVKVSWFISPMTIYEQGFIQSLTF